MRYTLITILSGLCLLTSCTVDGGKDIFDVPQTGYTLFEADFEDIDIAGDKLTALWDKDYGIGVYGSKSGENEKYTLKNAFDGKAAGEFYGALVEGEQIMAYYPYSENFSLYDGALTYSLATVQAYDSSRSLLEQFCAYAGYAYAFNNSDNKLRFSYVSGLLSVEVGFEVPVVVTGIELISENKSLAGVGKVLSDMTVEIGVGGVKKVALECAEGVISKSEGVFARYPIVLPAGTYEGVTLVIKAEGMDDIACRLDPFEIKPVTAGAYKVTEFVVGTGALGGFEIVGGLEFEQPQR